MNNIYKGKAKCISVCLILLFFCTVATPFTVKSTPYNNIYTFLTNDTIPDIKVISKPNATLISNDTLKEKFTVVSKDSFSIKFSKDSLDAPVSYHADDSMIYDVPGKKIILYGKKSRTTYKDNELTAPGIEFDQQTNLITASIVKDSLGRVVAYPSFAQSDFKSVSDTIRFNMKTGKGLTKGTYTQQGEMYIYGEKIRK